MRPLEKEHQSSLNMKKSDKDYSSIYEIYITNETDRKNESKFIFCSKIEIFTSYYGFIFIYKKKLRAKTWP